MKSALDPETFRSISPETHALRKKRHGMNAICRACKAEVFDHSVGSLKIMPHFNHEHSSGPCPIKGQPVEKDHADYSGDGERLRKEFYTPQSVQFAFSVCEALVCGKLQGDRFVQGNFTVDRFTELLRVADIAKKWSLKGLTPSNAPFALVAKEIFDIRYNKYTDPVTFVFAFNKKPEPYRRHRFDRPVSVDPKEPLRLAKYFMNDGTFGSLVRDLAPGNPYIVSEQSAAELAGPNWARLPMRDVQNILRDFIR